MLSANSSRTHIASTDPLWLRYLLPRFGDVLFVAIFLGVMVTGPQLLNADGDLGRHLTVGEYILQSRTIPTNDIFSHTLLGAPLTPHEWLAAVLFAAAHRVLGLDGVVILCALLLAGTSSLVYHQTLQRSGYRLLALGLAILAAAAGHIHWLARPHLWTMLLVAVWVCLLYRLRRGQTRLWYFPLAMLLWVNLHGAFIAGFAIWLLVGAGDLGQRWLHGFDEPPPAAGWPRRWLAAGVLSGLATLVNPVGLGVWQTSLGYLRNRYLVDHTYEYFSPNFHESAAWPFLLLICLSLLLMGMGWLRLNATGLALLIGWMAMGLYSARNIPLYAIIAAPLLAEGVAGAGLLNLENAGFTRRLAYLRLEDRLRSVESTLRGRLWPTAIVVLVTILLAGGAAIDLAGKGNQFSPSVFPVEAVNWLEEHPQPGNGFNHFPWGGYLLYRLWPQQKVFIDGQTDFYGEALTKKYETVITLGEGWEEIFEEYQISWVLLPRISMTGQILQINQHWQLVYSDDVSAILVQKP